jgi:hypothetical protein
VGEGGGAAALIPYFNPLVFRAKKIRGVCLKFSVLVITRGRVSIMTVFLSLMQRSIKFKDEVEILVGYDADDKDTVEAVDIWGRLFDLGIKWISFKRRIHINSYYNDLAKESRGEYLCICNDDTEYMTASWDEIVWLEGERQLNGRSKVIYIKPLCEIEWRAVNKFACFPIIGRKGYEVLGYVFNPKYYNWTADKTLYNAYKELNLVHEVPIDVFHNSYHTGRREKDDINKALVYRQDEGDDLTKEKLQQWLDVNK